MDISSIKQSKTPYDYVVWVYWFLFFLVVPVAIWMALRPSPPIPILQVNLPVLKQKAPAYHIITQKDVYLVSFNKSQVNANGVCDMQCYMHDLIGHYSLEAIFPGQPILRKQIGPLSVSGLFTNTLATAISANSVLTLGGSLHAGDVVELSIVPASNTNSPPVVVFKSVQVLDVKPTGNDFIIILAIPAAHWTYYLTEIRNATIVLSRPIA